MDFFEDDQTSDQGPPDNIHIMPTAQQTWEVGTTVDSECYLVAATQDGRANYIIHAKRQDNDHICKPIIFWAKAKEADNDDIIKSFF